MSANAFKEDMERSLNAGMNAHTTKPIEIEKLVELLSNYLPKQNKECCSWRRAAVYLRRFPSMIFMNTTATNVLTRVASMAGPTMAVGLALPYWLR